MCIRIKVLCPILNLLLEHYVLVALPGSEGRRRHFCRPNDSTMQDEINYVYSLNILTFFFTELYCNPACAEGVVIARHF